MLRNQEASTDHSRKRDDSSSNHIGFNRYPNMYGYPYNCHDNLVYVMPSDSAESSNEEPVTKNAGSRWREDETETLVEIWRNKICQTRWWKQSKGVRVNKEMWEEIAQLLAERDVYRTPSQCQIRMKNLLQFYRQTIDRRRTEKSWDDLPEYFEIVDRIMTRREGIDEKDSKHENNGLYADEMNDSSDANNDKEQKSSLVVPSDAVVSEGGEIGGRTSGSASESGEQKAIINKSEDQRKYPAMNNKPIKLEMSSSSYPNLHRNYLLPGASALIPNYYNQENFVQPIWSEHGTCCDGPPMKRQCFSNKEYVPSHSEFGASSQNRTSANQTFARSTNEFNDIDHVNGPHANGPRVLSENCRLQSCSHTQCRGGLQPPPQQRYPSVKSLASLPNKPDSCASSYQVLQEFMHVHYKQMERLVDIENKRLDVEERRLQEEREASNRNTAFLMEAVKIIAETFRKVDAKS